MQTRRNLRLPRRVNLRVALLGEEVVRGIAKDEAVNFEFYRTSVLTFGLVTPITNPRPFDLEALVLLNFRQIVRGLKNRRLRAHPDRAPRESAALWYERMLQRLARRGWRKSPGQTPHDFVAAIQEPALQKRVETFTRAYESARFGQSVDDARALPELFEEITAGNR